VKKAIATLLVTALAGALLVYAGMRSLDFIQLTLSADKQILAYFALAATEGGIVFWLLYFLSAARGGWQRGISLLMIIVDFVGSVALFTADTLLRSGEAGLITALAPEEMRSIILAMSGVIALNVAATIACHIFEPDTQKAQAIEEGQGEIDAQTLRKISEIAPSLAAELAPQIASEWAERTRAKYLSNMSTSSLLLPGVEAVRISKNGHKKPERVYDAEVEAEQPAFLASERHS
jgi:hypothetical protein